MKNTGTTIPWPRIAVEGIAIVASILLAFAIDAWWNDRQREETEQVVVRTLLNDLQGKQILLSDMNKFSETIVESVETLLTAASSVEHSLSENSIDRLIGDTWWVSNEAVWDSAPLNQLLAGGNLSVISNPNLVQQLAELKVAIDRVKYHSRNDSEFHERIMTPFMIANSNMSQITVTIRHRPGNPELTIQSRNLGVSEGYRHSELLATIEYQNLLVAKMERLSDLLEVGHRGIDERLSLVIEMLEIELDL
jgi:hypothetical protein